jgi:caa(3)-type oxidase subunit IV
MVVATVKAGLVAGYFMHLLSEEKVILWLLLLCAAFLVFLFVLPLGTETGNGPLWPG